MKTTKRHRKWIALAAVVLAVPALLFGRLYAQGFWDESRAVHIKAADIESSTLAIGTHLIHLSALTDSIYELAEKSAEESGQDQIYYKSELGGDAWFNISTATSLADITTGGSPVTDETIEELYFQYHTKSDKLTYDLRTGQVVNIFDIHDPYDLKTLEELSPLKMQYDQILETSGANDVTRRMDDVWNTPVSELDTVQELDRTLSGLQAYLQVLTDKDAAAEELDVVTGVMDAVDTARRYEVFTALEPTLSSFLDEVAKGELIFTTYNDDGTQTTETQELEESEPEVMSAVAESLGNVQNALITYGGRMLSEGTTVMSKTEYKFSSALISDAESGSYTACDKDVQDLILLGHIQNDVIADRPQELALLENTLLPEATSAYVQALGQGESAEYRAEAAKGSAQALLDRFITENEGEVNSRRGELEFLITAKCSRVDPASGMTFIDQRLELTTGSFSSAIPQDAFAETCQESVETHIEFLTEKRRALELASGGNAMDELTAQKEELQAQRLAALDKDDLAGAKALEEQLKALEESIRELEAELAAQIASAQAKVRELEQQLAADPDNTDLKNQLSAAKADLSNLENSLSDGTLGAMVAGLKQDALDGIGDGSDEGKRTAENAVDTLSGLLSTDPKLVLPAMQEIYNELLLNNGDQDLIDTLEQAILDNPTALRDDLSAAMLKELAEAYFTETGLDSGSSSSSGTTLLGTGGITLAAARRGAVELAALQMYYDAVGGSATLQRIAVLSQEQQALGNPLVVRQIVDGGNEYVPLPAIQTLTGWRYVWNKNSSLGVLAKGSDYYGFTVYSDVVRRDRSGVKSEEMVRAARLQSSVYIPEEYAYEQFGVQAVYLSGTSLACVLDDTALAQAQALLTRFLTA